MQDTYYLKNYKYKYNGKELQDELGLNMYDYGFRNYDPALGRWMNMDAKTEKYTPMSPYNYCANNPNLFIDPDGKDIYIYYVGPVRRWYNAPFYTLDGHNSLGAKPIGYHNTTYAALSGEATRTRSPRSYEAEYDFSTYINEHQTILNYVNNGDVVIRMRVSLPKNIEESIASCIATEAAYGRDQGGAWCTLRAKNILLEAFRDEGYTDEEAEKIIDKLMWYNTPEYPTAGEMLDAGIKGVDFYYMGGKDKNKFSQLNFDFGKKAENDENSKKKKEGLDSLLSDFQNLAAGKYTWNGSSWVRQ